MATTVQIAVTLDANGAVLGLKQLGDGFSKMTPPSPKVRQEFDGIESSERRAHLAGQLFVRTTGVEMPRALENVIARSRTLGPILAGAFNTAVFSAAGVAIFEFGKKAVEGVSALLNILDPASAKLDRMYEETVKASQDAFWNPKTLAAANEHMAQLRKQIDDLNREEEQASNSGALGFAGSGEELAGIVQAYGIEKERNELKDKGNGLTGVQLQLQREMNVLVAATAGKEMIAGKEGLALIQAQYAAAKQVAQAKLAADPNHDVEKFNLDMRIAAAERKAAEIQIEREGANQVIALRHQVLEESQTGIAKIRQVEEDALDDVMRKRDVAHTLTKGQAKEEIDLIQQRASEQRRLAFIDMEAQQRDAELFARQRASSFLKGSDQIIAQADIEKQTIINGLITQTEKAKEIGPEILMAWMNADTKLLAIDNATTAQLAMNQQQLRDKTIDLQQQAAIGALPEWQRAEATIRLEHEKTYQELNRLELTDAKNFALYEQQKAAADQLMNDHLRDEHKRLTEALGADLQSVFDDITSGNIGKRILANMEKLFFQILAQWILSLNMMKSAAGSIFGSIVFGPQSTGANVFGGGGQGGGSLLGGLLGGLFGGGSSSSESATVGFAGGTSSMAIPGLVGATPEGLGGAIAGTGAITNSALVSSAGNALTSSTMAEALPGLVGGTTSQAGSSSTRTSSFAAGSPLAGLAALAPALVGNFGGKLGQIGGLVSMLAILGNSQILSAVSGGLIGFGVGQSHGGFLGALSGAGSGALTGFLAAGPVGAIIGGLVGLIGGIFGGIFGGAKRKKQANAFADNTVLPDIAQIVTGYDGFQIDQSSAIQQLEQLRTDAQKQLSALKSQGKDVFNYKIAPAIDSAEKHIRDTQAERDRRSAIVFGPPQFATGGIFSTMGGNAGLAVLHDGEFVVNPEATKKNRGALEKINAGGAGGDFNIGNVNIIPRNLDRSYVMSSQFRKDLLDALDRARREGELRRGL